MLILLIILIIIVTVSNYVHYKPHLDLIKVDNKYKLLLWYNYWNDYDGVERRWIKLLEF